MAAVAVAAMALAAGCGSVAAQKAASTAPAAASAPASTAPATASSCTSQAYTWAHQGGGIAQLTAVGAATGAIGGDDNAIVAALSSGADTSALLARLTIDASQLGADSQEALANQPPACIPGEGAPYREAMAE